MQLLKVTRNCLFVQNVLKKPLHCTEWHTSGFELILHQVQRCREPQPVLDQFSFRLRQGFVLPEKLRFIIPENRDTFMSMTVHSCYQSEGEKNTVTELVYVNEGYSKLRPSERSNVLSTRLNIVTLRRSI